MEMIEFKSAGIIKVKSGKNKRKPFEHQEEAIINLNDLNNKQKSFRSLLVIPTGGGKTFTAVRWLLNAAINEEKKVLWIAHRHLLLEQAFDTFAKSAYDEYMANISNFHYRIVSGMHDKPINIERSDSVIIASKDSLVRNLHCLDRWLAGEDEIYLIIDEAHHATAKSYRKIIDYIEKSIPHLKLLGLTATPFRTAEKEVGLLGKIFTNKYVHKTDMTTLIKRFILSRPGFKEFDTEVSFGSELGLNDVRRIESQDSIPEYLAKEIALNKQRNRKIVDEYIENKDKYKQTLVFAVNREHAIELNGLFSKYNVNSAFIISGTKAEFIGIDISNKENAESIRKYRDGKIDVLINVNILTEGADLPKTQTVFLTRPTVSATLMTQMIGRALRGIAAGGTEEAYIVSFIDNWKDKIAWVNAEVLYDDEKIGFIDDEKKYPPKVLFRMISIDKIEEFTRLMDDTVDTRSIEKLDFIKRVPLGMYIFSFIEDEVEHNCQVLVYDSTKKYYEDMISSLGELFDQKKVEAETLPASILNDLCEDCKNSYFDDPNMIPTFNERDIRNLLRFYAQKESEPRFIRFDEIDRGRLDISKIAKDIIEKDMRQSEEKAYIDNVWEDENSLLKVYFNKKAFFKRQLENEKDKLDGDYDEIEHPTTNIIPEARELEKLSLYELGESYPDKAFQIKTDIFNKYCNEKGYFCAKCGKASQHKIAFQIDHITPMAIGGLTKLDNLQLLCRQCNLMKGDKDVKV